MLARLALLFVLVPAAELALLVWLSGKIGVWAELALIVATGFAGAALARYQGAATLRRLRADAAAGRAARGRRGRRRADPPRRGAAAHARA